MTTTNDSESIKAVRARAEAVTEELMKASASAAELARLCYEGQRRARESAELTARLTRALNSAENTIDALHAEVARLNAKLKRAEEMIATIGGTP